MIETPFASTPVSFSANHSLAQGCSIIESKVSGEVASTNGSKGERTSQPLVLQSVHKSKPSEKQVSKRVAARGSCGGNR